MQTLKMNATLDMVRTIKRVGNTHSCDTTPFEKGHCTECHDPFNASNKRDVEQQMVRFLHRQCIMVVAKQQLREREQREQEQKNDSELQGKGPGDECCSGGFVEADLQGVTEGVDPMLVQLAKGRPEETPAIFRKHLQRCLRAHLDRNVQQALQNGVRVGAARIAINCRASHA